jgi:DNA-binding NarL/FixJ family response regulator
MRKKLVQYCKFICFAYFLLGVVSDLTAQTTIRNEPSFAVKDYKILPDEGYTFKRILTDTSLKFKPDTVLRTSVSRSYWIKASLYNPYPNKENYILSVSGPLNCTFYYLDAEHNRWVQKLFGYSIYNGQRRPQVVAYTLKPQAKQTFYLKADLSGLGPQSHNIKLMMSMEKELVFNTHEQVSDNLYLMCCLALISFSCYNLYIYFNLKDSVYLHYVYTQFGALLYVTGMYYYFNLFIPLRIYNQQVNADGSITVFNINNVFIHASVAIIFWGLSRFTRSYLNTKQLLPTYDKGLRILANAYVVIEAIPTLLTITGVYFIELLVFDNILVLAIIVSCITTAIVAYNSGIKAAKPYLAAILLPSVITACVSVCILVYRAVSPVLPAMAILSQILTFAVALVARIKLANENLNAKAMEAVRLEAANTVIANQHLLMEQENKIINLNIALERERNTKLQDTLEANQRELMGNSVYINQKNKLLSELKTHIKDISTNYPDAQHDALRTIQSSLNDSEYLDDEWDKFKLHFEQVHPSFFENLQSAFPKLTKYEQRLYAYFHINMSTKEIATLLNIAPSSVRQAKARLGKKMRS